MKKDEKKTESVSFRIPKSMRAMLETMAEDHDRSLSWVIAKILEKHLKTKGAKID